MRQCITLVLISVFFISCEAQPDPSEFSKDALDDTFLSLDGETMSFESILNEYKGKTVLIDIWATWCRDCIIGLPDLKALQNEYPEVVYLFLSMDKTQKSWKNGIEKYNITGEHYFMPSGWDGPFTEFLDLDWIPRYMVIDTEGKITLFRAIKASDPKIREQLK